MKIFAILALCFTLTFTGCGTAGGGSTGGTGTGTPPPSNPNKPLILMGITTGTEIATNQGLILLAKSKPAVALETATALKRAIDTVLTPYLNGASTVPITSAALHELLNSSLFTGVDPTIRQAIAAAGAILDAYLPAPTASSYLSADQLDYVHAFLNGISKGCGDFSGAGVTGAVLQPKTNRSLEQRWVKPE